MTFTAFLILCGLLLVVLGSVHGNLDTVLLGLAAMWLGSIINIVRKHD